MSNIMKHADKLAALHTRIQRTREMNNELPGHRVKLVQLDTRLLVDILNWWQNPPGFLALPITPELPEDTVVLDVHTNFGRRTIDLLVASAEWPKCPIGQEPERISGVVTEFRVVEFPERKVEQ